MNWVKCSYRQPVILSEVEGSRSVTFKVTPRDSPTSVGMTDAYATNF